MSEKVLYWSSLVFSVVALLLLITNTTLVNGNRSLQDEVSMRQGTINRAVNMTQLNQNLAQALANVVVTKEDNEIKDLLTSQGISVRKNDPKAKAAEDAAAKK